MTKMGEVILGVLLTAGSVHGGQGAAEGNSSDAWVCRDSAGEIIGELLFLRDLGWVKDELNIKPDLEKGSTSELGIIKTANLLLDRLTEFDPLRSDMFRPEVEELAEVFEDYVLKKSPGILPLNSPNTMSDLGSTDNLFYDNVNFSPTALSPKAHPDGCAWERVIRYQEPLVPEMKQFKVNTEIFDHLTNKEMGVVAFHEVINKAAVASENKRNAQTIREVGTLQDVVSINLETIANTYRVWYFVGKLVGDAIEDISEYAHSIAQLRFEELNFRGMWIDPQSVEFPRTTELVQAVLTRPYIFEMIGSNPDIYEPGEIIVFNTSGEADYERTREINSAKSTFGMKLEEGGTVGVKLKYVDRHGGLFRECEIAEMVESDFKRCDVLLPKGEYRFSLTIFGPELSSGYFSMPADNVWISRVNFRIPRGQNIVVRTGKYIVVSKDEVKRVMDPVVVR